MKTRTITEKEIFDRPLFDKDTYDRIMAESARRVQDVAAQLKSRKKLKGVKLSTQEWIEVSHAIGGFKQTPPPKPFLVPGRKKGAWQQMEFTFDGPQAVAPVRKRRRREANGKSDGAA
jgi:hypothetical protein